MLTPNYFVDRYIPDCGVFPDQLPVVAQVRPRHVRLADPLGAYGPGG